MKMRPEKYLRYLYLPNLMELFGTARTKEILSINPTIIPVREEAAKVVISAYVYNKEEIKEYKNISVDEALKLKCNDHIIWINVDGLRKDDVDRIGDQYGINQLLREDILSINQRPKVDEVDEILFSLMDMLYYNVEKRTIEQEQISLVLGKRVVLTFQEDPERDLFNPLRERLKLPTSKTRGKEADYLYYTLIDTIVDYYFVVMDKLRDNIEDMEEDIIRGTDKRSLARINVLRKELIVLKRGIFPVREVVAGIIKSDSELLTEFNVRFYKDVYDHIVQAIDLVENYRDMILGMQDLYISNVNLRMNEVMKVMAIVTCLLAPATVIGGIFGMNFQVIPLSEHHWGFWIAVAVMFGIPILMLLIFKKRGWF
ncbi:MAG TPA: magnesium/cobalt transporter CorA [Niabella sp.]|nr:magnesium/cobalt transporter CorA [Niabella sp.]HOZ95976.1 magnesium/cobalt transporter CorA [Niabella sp.]HQW15529.1 magnesium/cobalt transporter CorA [Niabella sp.]HQX20672.1 magnesium/cobalt transporter CorA [Niabella sp.]HQX40547.1 magnesium/cobalt transporter CorA [Niabella sp.]